MTTAQHMLWMLDEYEVISGAKYPGFTSGKPIGMGGAHGKRESTGYGAVIALREVMREKNIDLSNTVASVQGFGNVAQYAIQLYLQIGGNVLSIASWNQRDNTAYTFRKKDGVNYEELATITNHFGEIDKEKAQDLGYEILAGESWLEQSVDILIPAALENQITIDNATKIMPRVKYIVEGANGPISPEADKILLDRGIFILPDLLANAGGVICSYFEQVQSNNNYYWQKEEVLGQLDFQMTAAYRAVSEFSQTHQVCLREAAHLIAVDRVALACRERGWL
jgi:glutamate dehydrogenase (NAD(P)+)